jgi:hypothetical protein
MGSLNVVQVSILINVPESRLGLIVVYVLGLNKDFCCICLCIQIFGLLGIFDRQLAHKFEI